MENTKQVASYSIGLPNIVVGCLLALKFTNLTEMSYIDIFWYGIKVWFVCIIIALAVFMLINLFVILFSKY